MEAVTNFFERILNQFSNANFALLIIVDFVAIAVVFLATLLGCILSPAVRAHDKRAYLYAVNAFTALTLAIFLIRFSLAQAVASAAVYWCLGYLSFGILCLFKVKKRAPESAAIAPPAQTVSAMPAPRPRTATPQPAPATPQAAVQSGVRLDHALSIADKLLLKNLGRGDRQELEKIKTSLTILKVKGILSVQEGEALNEMFNALLKLMAKYDL